jgi:hypothetical protein
MVALLTCNAQRKRRPPGRHSSTIADHRNFLNPARRGSFVWGNTTPRRISASCAANLRRAAMNVCAHRPAVCRLRGHSRGRRKASLTTIQAICRIAAKVGVPPKKSAAKLRGPLTYCADGRPHACDAKAVVDARGRILPSVPVSFRVAPALKECVDDGEPSKRERHGVRRLLAAQSPHGVMAPGRASQDQARLCEARSPDRPAIDPDGSRCLRARTPLDPCNCRLEPLSTPEA